ncbi:unnamed protein product, partial [Cladocopium goreaui]
VSFLALSTFLSRRREARRDMERPAAHASRLARGGAWRAEVQVAVRLAVDCGKAMRDCLQKKVVWKDDSSIDPVTATDKENEQRVIAGLRAAFPTHEIIGEESAAARAQQQLPPATLTVEDAPTWIVDPIDGTTNFVYGIKLSCVSLGFCVGRQPVLGVVYDPYADELFVAAKGEGAYLNGARLCIDPAKSLKESMVLFELGYERSQAGLDRILNGLKALLLHGTRATRTLGTAVLSLCWVASGRANAYYTGLSGEGGKPWDYAAGTIIAMEAGAKFCNLQGGPFDIEGPSCLCASSNDLAQEILSVLKSV